MVPGQYAMHHCTADMCTPSHACTHVRTHARTRIQAPRNRFGSEYMMETAARLLSFLRGRKWRRILSLTNASCLSSQGCGACKYVQPQSYHGCPFDMWSAHYQHGNTHRPESLRSLLLAGLVVRPVVGPIQILAIEGHKNLY